MKKIKKLFAFDLDGTLLSDSKTGTVSETVKKTIEQLKNEGHIVCIFTGRPWRATSKIYDELQLDTVVVNYNGAYVHHPKDYSFIPFVANMPVNYVMKIVESKQLKKIAQNIVIEGPQYIHISKQEKSHFTDSFIQVDDKSIINHPIQFHKMYDKPTGVLVEIKKEFSEQVSQITDYFKSRYGDMVSFSYWETGKDNNPIMEFTNFRARKEIALIKIARYYGISMSNTVAFGDGFNDVGMLKTAGVGVAMANSSDVVKSYANVISRRTNKEDGIAKFITWYFNGGSKKVDKTIYSLGGKTSEFSQVKEENGK